MFALLEGAPRRKRAKAARRRRTEHVPEERWLCCARCRAKVTTKEQAIEIDGQHVHLRLNPAGYSFVFGCFSSAPGAAALGQPTSDATWFTGCLWNYAHCAGCGTHLGWHFEGAGKTFFGLVLERLIELSTPRA